MSDSENLILTIKLMYKTQFLKALCKRINYREKQDQHERSLCFLCIFYGYTLLFIRMLVLDVFDI